MADIMKMAWNVGSVNTRKECCGEVKKLPRLLLGVIDVKPAGFIVTFRRETKEFKLPESCCHSSYRYLHQRLLSIVP